MQIYPIEGKVSGWNNPRKENAMNIRASSNEEKMNESRNPWIEMLDTLVGIRIEGSDKHMDSNE